MIKFINVSISTNNHSPSRYFMRFLNTIIFLMANLYSSDNFENMSFDPFQRNSVLLDNLSDPDFNFFNNNNLEAVNTKYFSLDELESHLSTADEKNFSLLHINIRSMSKNFEKLKSLLLNMNFEFKIICLTETWCKSDDDKTTRYFKFPITH